MKNIDFPQAIWLMFAAAIVSAIAVDSVKTSDIKKMCDLTGLVVLEGEVYQCVKVERKTK